MSAAAPAKPRAVQEFLHLDTKIYPETLIAALHAQRKRPPGASLANFQIIVYWSQGGVLGVKIEVFELDETNDRERWNFAGRFTEIFSNLAHYDPELNLLTHAKGIRNEHTELVPFGVGQFVNGQFKVSYDEGLVQVSSSLAITEYSEEEVAAFERRQHTDRLHEVLGYAK